MTPSFYQNLDLDLEGLVTLIYIYLTKKQSHLQLQYAQTRSGFTGLDLNTKIISSTDDDIFIDY